MLINKVASSSYLLKGHISFVLYKSQIWIILADSHQLMGEIHRKIFKFLYIERMESLTEKNKNDDISLFGLHALNT